MQIKEMYNSIPKQNKTGSDRITQAEWNAYINILALQTNNNAKMMKSILEYSKELNSSLIKQMVIDTINNALADKLFEIDIDPFDIFKGTVTVLANNFSELSNQTIDSFLVEYISDTFKIKALVINGNERGLYELNQELGWEKVKDINKGEVYSVDKGRVYGGTTIAITDEGCTTIMRSSKFEPIISGSEPSLEEIYLNDGVWFEKKE